MLRLARSLVPCLAVAAVLVAVACGESIVSSGDTAPTVPARVPAGLPASGPAADSSATVAEVPGWEEIVGELEMGECVAYWRRASGEYTLEMAEIRFSDEALSGPDTAVQEKLLLRQVPGTDEEELGLKAICVFPHTEAGREELLAALDAIFPDESNIVGDVGEGATAAVVPTVAAALGGIQSDDDPVPCYKLPPGSEVDYWCPHLVSRVTRDDCTLGFDWDEWMQTCVKSFVGRGTGTGGGGGTGGGEGTGGSGGRGTTPPPAPPPPPEPPEPNCTDDQIAIAEEYGDPAAWPCDVFTHGVTPGRGTHGHRTGYLTASYISGSGVVFAKAGVSGAHITSDWRCPTGNSAVGGVGGSQHVLGTAGDFSVSGFDDDDAADFEDAAEAAAAGYWYSSTEHTHIDWR